MNSDRHDHVASRGLAKKRVAAITSLPGQPFVIVINYQLPGDPPVSLVSYFAGIFNLSHEAVILIINIIHQFLH